MKETNNDNADSGDINVTPDNSPRHRKLAAHFVDEITNITLSTNGASRIYFATWSVDELGRPVRIDSELIMTRETMKRLAEVLPGALAQSNKPGSKPPPEGEGGPRPGKGLFRNRSH